MINYKHQIITGCQFKPLIDKPMRLIYKQAKNINELELMYLFGIESIKQVDDITTLYYNDNKLICFIKHNDKLYFEYDEIPSSLRIDILRIEYRYIFSNEFGCPKDELNVLQNINLYPYFKSYLRNKILSNRLYYRRKDCIWYDDQRHIILKTGYYISHIYGKKGFEPNDYLMIQIFGDLYISLLPTPMFGIYSNPYIMLYSQYMKDPIISLVPKRTVVEQKISKIPYIYPLQQDIRCAIVDEKYEGKIDFQSLRKDSYQLICSNNRPIIDNKQTNKYFMVKYCKTKSKYKVLPHLAIPSINDTNTYQLGYVYKPYLISNSVNWNDIHIHNYILFGFKKYCDISILVI